MKPRDHDPELRELISGDDSLHEQLARLDRSEPPEDLDRIVIERARQAIRTPAAERPIRQFRWAVPVALAATLLLSFALVLQIGPHAPAPASETATARVDPEQPMPAQARVEDPTEMRALTPPPVVVAPPVAPAVADRPSADAAVPQTYERSLRGAENAARAREAPEAALAKRESRAVELQATTAAAAHEQADTEKADTGDAAATTDLRADPDAWLAAIAQLRQQGRHEEADREYAEYRRLYPHKKYGAPSPAGDVAPDR